MFNEVVKALELYGQAKEVSEVSTFIFWRNNVEYVAEVSDRGSSAGDLRYAVKVFQADIELDEFEVNTHRVSYGNPAGNIDDAICNIHWHSLQPED